MISGGPALPSFGPDCIITGQRDQTDNREEARL